MDTLLKDLPELATIIVECLEGEDKTILSFALSCRDADDVVNYVYKIKCLKLCGSFRGWKQKDVDDGSHRWGKLHKEAFAIRRRTLFAWSFHNYTSDATQRVYDHSKNRCCGIRISTKIAEGQFGKALHLSPSVANQGAQVLAMLSTAPSSPVNKFTISFWLQIISTDTSPILSLLFAQKFTMDQQNIHQPLTFILLYINSQSQLFLGQTGPESYYSLTPHKWYHLVMTNDSHTVRVYVHQPEEKGSGGGGPRGPSDGATGTYLEILSAPQQHSLVFEKLTIMLGSGKKGNFMIEEMSMVGSLLHFHEFWWLQHGLPFVCNNN